MCGKKRERRGKRNTWWWNEKVKEAVSWKKDAHKAICQDNTEENKRRYKGMKNKTNKAVSEAMREKAEKTLTELCNCPNGMFKLVK